MSVVKQWHIQCDVKDCGEQHAVEPGLDVTQARLEAMELGWYCVLDVITANPEGELGLDLAQDLCPEHRATHVRRKRREW